MPQSRQDPLCPDTGSVAQDGPLPPIFCGQLGMLPPLVLFTPYLVIEHTKPLLPQGPCTGHYLYECSSLSLPVPHMADCSPLRQWWLGRWPEILVLQCALGKPPSLSCMLTLRHLSPPGMTFGVYFCFVFFPSGRSGMCKCPNIPESKTLDSNSV